MEVRLVLTEEMKERVHKLRARINEMSQNDVLYTALSLGLESLDREVKEAEKR